jgi:hypothetical protein
VSAPEAPSGRGAPDLRVLNGSAASGPRGRWITTVLLAGAVLSMVVGLIVTRAFFFVWVSAAQSRVGLVVQITLMVTIPVVLFIVALVRVEAGPVRRVLAILITVVAVPMLLVGVLSGGLVQLLATSVAASSLLASWATVQRPRRAAWWLAVAPILVIAALGACRLLVRMALDVPLPMRALVEDAQGLVFVAVPLLTAVVSGAVIARSARYRALAGGTSR